ncbi:MAG: TrkA C-terminal domain-containing protein [Halanaeroarchaeum sp.]
MATLPAPVEVLRGIYLGVLTGVLPAVLAFGFGFAFRYVTGVTIPSFAVIGLGLALAGVNGGLLALVDPSITGSANSVALMTAVVVISMLSLYTHALGDRLGESAPRRLSLASLRSATVSADVVDLVGGRGEVAVTVAGEVRDLEGYPTLPDSLRADLGEVEWRFPADLPIDELESRMAERYRTTFDLQDVTVSIDRRGRAVVAAAPPTAGVSDRLETGTRAASVEALIPSGVARGDAVSVLLDGAVLEGTVVSARSADRTPATQEGDGGAVASPDSDVPPDRSVPTPRAPTTTGGWGRITVALDPAGARTLLAADEAAVVIDSRGSRSEFELVSFLRHAGQRLARLTVRPGGPLDGATLAEADLREEYGVAVLAVRGPSGWVVGPRGETTLEGDVELFVAGRREGLRRVREAVA